MSTSQLEPLTYRTLISRRGLYVVTGVLIALMLIGSVFDYAISLNIFNPSSGFAVFFAAFGEAPAFLSWVAAGTLLVRHRNRDRRTVGALQILGAAILCALGTLMAIMMPGRYLTETSPVLLGTVSVALVAGTVALTWTVSRGTNRRMAIRVATVLFLVPLLEILIINLIKIVWERPRMRMLEQTPEASFMHWWLPGYDAKADLLVAGIEAEEFKSFPSGHTANAAVAMLMTSFAALKGSLRRHTEILFYSGFAWALLVAVSRVVIGAHFLTDVTVGLSITFLTIVIAYRIAFPLARDGVST